jgi:N utilization substance protein B
MLNRRILRVKAMQGLYAYYNSLDANYNLAIDRINENFDSQLINDHSLDKKEIEKKKELAVKAFQESVIQGSLINSGGESMEPDDVAKQFYDQYLDAVKKDQGYFRKNIIAETEKIFDLYLMLLILPSELAEEERREAGSRTVKGKNDPEKKKSGEASKFASNIIVAKLGSDVALKEICTRKKINWRKFGDAANEFYVNLLKKDPEFIKYRDAGKGNIDDDRDFCLHLFKDILLKNSTFNDFMETLDINWADDAEVVRSMILKTVKSIQENTKKIEFSSLSKNWPEDKEFFKEIFDVTIRNDKEYDEMIARKSTNWDISRIALTDRIILKMAIGEMINFPGIPVKVSINEYIELSKNFSTPKSKKFVNGILDVVSIELLKKGVIKKSGRGLIDNQ